MSSDDDVMEDVVEFEHQHDSSDVEEVKQELREIEQAEFEQLIQKLQLGVTEEKRDDIREVIRELDEIRPNFDLVKKLLVFDLLQKLKNHSNQNIETTSRALLAKWIRLQEEARKERQQNLCIMIARRLLQNAPWLTPATAQTMCKRLQGVTSIETLMSVANTHTNIELTKVDQIPSAVQIPLSAYIEACAKGADSNTKHVQALIDKLKSKIYQERVVALEVLSQLSMTSNLQFENFLTNGLMDVLLSMEGDSRILNFKMNIILASVTFYEYATKLPKSTIDSIFRLCESMALKKGDDAVLFGYSLLSMAEIQWHEPRMVITQDTFQALIDTYRNAVDVKVLEKLLHFFASIFANILVDTSTGMRQAFMKVPKPMADNKKIELYYGVIMACITTDNKVHDHHLADYGVVRAAVSASLEFQSIAIRAYPKISLFVEHHKCTTNPSFYDGLKEIIKACTSSATATTMTLCSYELPYVLVTLHNLAAVPDNMERVDNWMMYAITDYFKKAFKAYQNEPQSYMYHIVHIMLQIVYKLSKSRTFNATLPQYDFPIDVVFPALQDGNDVIQSMAIACLARLASQNEMASQICQQNVLHIVKKHLFSKNVDGRRRAFAILARVAENAFAIDADVLLQRLVLPNMIKAFQSDMVTNADAQYRNTLLTYLLQFVSQLLKKFRNNPTLCKHIYTEAYEFLVGTASSNSVVCSLIVESLASLAGSSHEYKRTILVDQYAKLVGKIDAVLTAESRVAMKKRIKTAFSNLFERLSFCDEKDKILLFPDLLLDMITTQQMVNEPVLLETLIRLVHDSEKIRNILNGKEEFVKQLKVDAPTYMAQRLLKALSGEKPSFDNSFEYGMIGDIARLVMERNLMIQSDDDDDL